MKFYSVLIVLVCSVFVKAEAQILITQTAKVQFFSKTPLEDISAVNSKVSSLINTATDSVFFKMKNTEFVFKNALMQDHFNENYMESDKYPFDSFKGKINQKIDFTKDGVHKVSATGKITIHGTERPITSYGTLTIKEGQVQLESEFTVRTADFKIDVPKLVFNKIAEELKISLSASYKPYKK